jgi:hypothetical protein
LKELSNVIDKYLPKRSETEIRRKLMKTKFEKQFEARQRDFNLPLYFLSTSLEIKSEAFSFLHKEKNLIEDSKLDSSRWLEKRRKELSQKLR